MLPLALPQPGQDVRRLVFLLLLLALAGFAVWWLVRRSRGGGGASASKPSTPPGLGERSSLADRFAADMRQMSDTYDALLRDQLSLGGQRPAGRARGSDGGGPPRGGTPPPVGPSRPVDPGLPPHSLVMDAECVDDARDYVPVVRDLAALARPWLRFDRIDCTEGPTRWLELAQGGRSFSVELRGQTDWLDIDPLLRCLNEALADLGAPGRLHELETGYDDQCVGFVYAEPDEERALVEAGRLLTPFTRPASAEVDYPAKPGTEVGYHPNARVARLTLARDVDIQGIPCAGGSPVNFDREGVLQYAVLARPHRLGGIRVPAGARVAFYEESLIPSEIVLREGDSVHGLALPAASTLGFGEDAALIYAILGRDAEVLGTPCKAGRFVTFRNGAWILED